MFVVTHVLMGGLIGENTPTPIVAGALGVASHFILDLIPHGDSYLYYDYKEGKGVAKSLVYTIVDAVLAVVVLVYMLEIAPYASRGTMVCAIVGAIIPDALVALAEIIPIRPLIWFANAHMRIHDSVSDRIGHIRPSYGMIIQTILFCFLFFLVTIKPLK
jgi:glycerol-3-phosphate acyltransferase PlsY